MKICYWPCCCSDLVRNPKASVPWIPFLTIVVQILADASVSFPTSLVPTNLIVLHPFTLFTPIRVQCFMPRLWRHISSTRINSPLRGRKTFSGFFLWTRFCQQDIQVLPSNENRCHNILLLNFWLRDVKCKLTHYYSVFFTHVFSLCPKCQIIF